MLLTGWGAGVNSLETFLSGMETCCLLRQVPAQQPLKPSLVEWKRKEIPVTGHLLNPLETFLSGMETQHPECSLPASGLP